MEAHVASSGAIPKAFQQPGPQTVVALEILGHWTRAQTQDTRGQVLAMDARADEKSVHLEHSRQMLHALGNVPSDPLIAILQI